MKGPEEEPPTEAPKFTHFLRDIEVAESKRAHFEARVIPLGDATMQIEWLLDGRPLAASKNMRHIYNSNFILASYKLKTYLNLMVIFFCLGSYISVYDVDGRKPFIFLKTARLIHFIILSLGCLLLSLSFHIYLK